MLKVGLKVGWPHRAYLVNFQYRFIYCPIPKVACTSIKQWMLSVAGVDPPDAVPDVHGYLHRRSSLRALGWLQARQLLADPLFFKFAFVRNPYSRLVSGYLNKFLNNAHAARDVLRQLGRSRPRLKLWQPPDRQQAEDGAPGDEGITFRQFVDYLGSVRPIQLDEHWRPQQMFLGRHRFDFIGRFERLGEDFDQLRQRLGIETQLPFANRTHYTPTVPPAANLSDWSPARLRTLNAFPRYHSFYTPELVDSVSRICRREMDLFGYSFGDAEALDRA